jgi:hypothetical protein
MILIGIFFVVQTLFNWLFALFLYLLTSALPEVFQYSIVSKKPFYKST